MQKTKKALESGFGTLVKLVCVLNNMAETVGLDFRHLAQVVVTTRHTG